jgi:hypothetical protein
MLSQGVLTQANNKIGPMKNDMDVDVTFEGDNTVMMQQVAKALLDTASKTFTRPTPPMITSSSFGSAGAVLSLLAFRYPPSHSRIRRLGMCKFSCSESSMVLPTARPLLTDRP